MATTTTTTTKLEKKRWKILQKKSGILLLPMPRMEEKVDRRTERKCTMKMSEVVPVVIFIIVIDITLGKAVNMVIQKKFPVDLRAMRSIIIGNAKSMKRRKGNEDIASDTEKRLEDVDRNRMAVT